ncbi:MAG: alcohol dehydrogenase catalytic domain-containing protein [Deltaproteobacteria bacterium]|nr:alcohol dehydrogenase catalytic domain-containing protein [Deltaproteobacteria bacterium]MBI2179427.1 alcohol dehydrogenase catalytic domain-containing protein [Deltaproteobacteria bacterium]MBI2228418.1 alcohol dehydrogenase catalytic domain-containing protein [Deltaproteobacteria bacterium]MBI2367494.1 alcohol dehydrogenase catalytic domain-containing protein [Deltaproteobacteria bacterium]MBI2531007.1 alcohol dehydrogenase catalytic domain-containing protein [Deltaproteobacteria bacterium
MNVAVYYNNRDVRLEQVAVPKIGAGELLVRIRASGICGSDLMEWYRIKKAPLVLGHEITGEVVEVGEGVENFRVGDRVFASHHVPCGTCRYCLAGHQSVCDMLRTTHFEPGGFAEYIRVPKINVELGTHRLPDEVTFDEGSFIEPLACVVRAQRFARMTAGQSVLVIGSGISGLLHIQLAKSSGAARIMATDISEFRLNAARRFGADATIHGTEDVPARLRDLNDGRLADLVIVCTGAMPAIQQAVKSIDRGGTLLFFAPTAAGVDVPIPLFDFWRDEISLVTSYAGSGEDLAQSIELIQTQRVRVAEMVTHRLPLAETGVGFQLTASGQDSIKVIIDPLI